MKIIFGLGNPGDKYSKTRHNIGFILLNLLAEKLEVSFRFNSNFNAEIAETVYAGEKILFCKPQTFMNNSGQTVQSLINYFKISPQEILVIQDEIDLPFGQIKFSKDSGSAGHKGIQSIIAYLKTKKFKRLRFGIKAGGSKLPTEIFVLRNFSKDNLTFINKIETKTFLEKITK